MKALDHKPRSLGILDIGSNSIRLVAYDLMARPPKRFFNEKIITALGKELEKTGRLYSKGKKRTRSALQGFLTLGKVLNLDHIVGVATAASRDAEDGEEFINSLNKKFGIRIDIIDGAHEATLSAMGVYSAFPKANGIVADLGGGSLELAILCKSKITRAQSLKLGALRIASHQKKAAGFVQKNLDLVKDSYRTKTNLYCVGGTWRAIAGAYQKEQGSKFPDSHGLTIDAQSICAFLDKIIAMKSRTMEKRYGIEKKRTELMPYAAIMMKILIQTMGIKQVVFSNAGLRDGLIYKITKGTVQTSHTAP